MAAHHRRNRLLGEGGALREVALAITAAWKIERRPDLDHVALEAKAAAERRDERRPRLEREGDRRRGGHAGAAEEVDAHAGVVGVLVGEHADDGVCAQKAEHFAARAVAVEEHVAGEAAQPVDRRVEALPLEADHRAEGIAAERERRAEQFPVAEVGGEEEGAAAGGEGAVEVLEPAEGDDRGEPFAGEGGEAQEFEQVLRLVAEDPPHERGDLPARDPQIAPLQRLADLVLAERGEFVGEVAEGGKRRAERRGQGREKAREASDEEGGGRVEDHFARARRSRAAASSSPARRGRTGSSVFTASALRPFARWIPASRSIAAGWIEASR